MAAAPISRGGRSNFSRGDKAFIRRFAGQIFSCRVIDGGRPGVYERGRCARDFRRRSRRGSRKRAEPESSAINRAAETAIV